MRMRLKFPASKLEIIRSASLHEFTSAVNTILKLVSDLGVEMLREMYFLSNVN